MEVWIACVVEGHGEVRALPELVRRVARELDPALQLRIPHPIRKPKTKLIQPDEFHSAIELAARNLRGPGGILVLLDADEDCPADLGPRLQRMAAKARGDVPSAVVLAKVEYEAWFLAAAESLRGRRGLQEDLEAPPDPEAIRGAKEWLTTHMREGAYSETVDQAPLTALMDLEQARRSPSFDKCYREIGRLVRTLRARWQYDDS